MYSRKQLGRVAVAVVAAGATAVAVGVAQQDGASAKPVKPATAKSSAKAPVSAEAGTQALPVSKSPKSGLPAAGGRTQTAAPKFLAPKELPPHPASEWFAEPVKAGLPEIPVFCLEGGVLPRQGASHRLFGTEFDTGAMQLVFKTGGVEQAKRLTARLSASLRNCAADFEARTPGGWADGKDYGAVTAQDGARVFGVATSAPESEYGISLFGVGRDGRTVTVVKWSQMGGFADAPVAAFKKTTATALTKLYP